MLKAYSIHNPVDGYCQAQAPIAAVLLMHMPAEQAFWCLVSICEKYLPGYYSVGLVCVYWENTQKVFHIMYKIRCVYDMAGLSSSHMLQMFALNCFRAVPSKGFSVITVDEFQKMS